MSKVGNDYSKTVIYRIPVGDDNYYGHTTQALHKSKSEHKKAYQKHPDRKVYKAIHDAGMSSNDIELIWVEDWSCKNVDQARARERYWVERYGTLNMYIYNNSNNLHSEPSCIYLIEVRQSICVKKELMMSIEQKKINETVSICVKKELMMNFDQKTMNETVSINARNMQTIKNFDQIH